MAGNQQKYFYIQRKNSIMGEAFNPRKMDRIEIAEEIHLFVSEKHPDLIKAADARCFLAAVQTFREVPLKSEYKEYIDLIWDEIKKYRKGVITDSNVKFPHKVIAVSTYLGKYCLNILGKCYSRCH